MRSQLVERAGCQVPRLEVRPPWVATSGGDVADLAASCGLVLDPWQRHVLDVACAEDADGRFSAIEVGLCVPRQNGKGSCIEARLLAGLTIFDEQLLIYSAHLFDTAMQTFKRLLRLIDGDPEVAARFNRPSLSNGKEGITTRDGRELRIRARSKGGARGFTADLVVFDEAMILEQSTIGDMLPTLSARPNPQVWFCGSAGLSSSRQWASLRRRAADGGGGRFAWLEWSAPPGADRADPATWAAANPALGVRIMPEFVETELRSMAVEEFDRERLGQWDPLPEDDRDPIVDPEAWARCMHAEAVPDGRMAIGIDVAADRSASSVVVAGRWLGRPTVEVIRQDRGTDWVVAEVVAMAAMHRFAAVVLAADGPAGSLLQPLEAAGVQVTRATLSNQAAAAGQFVDAVASGAFACRADPRLDVAVASAVRRTAGEAWALSRGRSPGDISPLVAATLALWGAGTPEAPELEWFLY
jgi:hypothetical protein